MRKKHKELYQLIDKAKVISFDIFDTLVFRPYLKPSDIFNLIERDHQAIGFFEARINAEKIARSKLITEEKEEILLKEIYEYIEPWFQHLQSTEIDYEISHVFRNNEMGKFYDYAINSKKEVVLTSDMYLPREAVDLILKNCGYTQHQQVYLSSERGRQKVGTLFSDLKKEYQIRKKPELVHIGDNHHGDVESAIRFNFTAYHYPKILEQYCRASPNFTKYLEVISSSNDVDLSYLLMMVALYVRDHEISPSSFFSIGVEIVWPLSMLFCFWVAKGCVKKNIKKLYFLSRDGFLFKKFFDEILSQYFDFSTFKLYGSRKAIAVPIECTYDRNYSLILYRAPEILREKHDLIKIFWKTLGLYDKELTKKFLNYIEKLQPIDGNFSIATIRNFMCIERNTIVRCFEKEKEMLVQYLWSIKYFNEPCAIIDIGWEGTMQRAMNLLALEKGIISKTFGFYFGTGSGCTLSSEKSAGFLMDHGKPDEHAKVVQAESIDLIELFFTVPAQSVSGFEFSEGNPQPTFIEPSPGENQRIKISQEVNNGVDKMIEYFKENAMQYKHAFSPKPSSSGAIKMIDIMREHAKNIQKTLDKTPVFYGHSDIFQKTMQSETKETIKA